MTSVCDVERCGSTPAGAGSLSSKCNITDGYTRCGQQLKHAASTLHVDVPIVACKLAAEFGRVHTDDTMAVTELNTRLHPSSISLLFYDEIVSVSEDLYRFSTPYTLCRELISSIMSIYKVHQIFCCPVGTATRKATLGLTLASPPSAPRAGVLLIYPSAKEDTNHARATVGWTGRWRPATYRLEEGAPISPNPHRCPRLG
ncbi:hypothetical protein J6590_055424 [Homalodisca vitripennis]|nr:hypothetical protein J6590_055424 [Homalodisca vitripennis]